MTSKPLNELLGKWDWGRHYIIKGALKKQKEEEEEEEEPGQWQYLACVDPIPAYVVIHKVSELWHTNHTHGAHIHAQLIRMH